MDFEQDFFMQSLQACLKAYEQEPAHLRPKNTQGQPGGLIRLDPALDCLIIPDLHGRESLLLHLMKYRLAGESLTRHLRQGKIQLLFLGDYPHSEGQEKKRWIQAIGEFNDDFENSPAMDQEMQDNLNCWLRLFAMKAEFGPLVHFLKGNHDNVLNENKGGNRSVSKFAREGLMVKSWIIKKLGPEVLEGIHQWEANLPLVAMSERFCASHARPNRAYQAKELIEANEDTTYQFTWTRNDTAKIGAAPETMKSLWGHSAGLWFTGHTPITRNYEWNHTEAIIELHNPEKFRVAHLRKGSSFDPERDVINLLD